MKKIGVLILLAFILGLFRVFLVYTPTGINILSLLNIKWYFYILIFILTFYVTLTLHELGHLFSFLVQKVRIKALYLTFFVFVKENKKWKFKVHMPLIKILGGLVIPDLNNITNDEEYERLKNVFIKALKAAPIVTITYFVISITLVIVLPIFVNATLLNSFLYLHFLFAIPISILYIFSFNLNTKNMYGDFVAAKKMKEELFSFTQLNQYIMFSSQIHNETKIYMYNKNLEELKSGKSFYDFFAKNLLLVYMNSVVEDGFPIDNEIHEKLKNFNFFNFKKDELTISLIHAFILYSYINGDVDKAYDIYFRVKNLDHKLGEKYIKYINKKTAYLINYENNADFLNDNDNIYIGDYWIFEPLFPNLYEDLKKTHKPLKYKQYVSEVYCDIN